MQPEDDDVDDDGWRYFDRRMTVGPQNSRATFSMARNEKSTRELLKVKVFGAGERTESEMGGAPE